MAFSSVFLTCSWLTTSAKDCGRYFLAITWYMGWGSGCREDNYARPRVIRGTRTAPLPLLPSGPGGVCSRPLHEARDLTSIYRSLAPRRDSQAGHAHAHAFAQKRRAFPGGQGEQAADQVARTQPWPTVSLRRGAMLR